MISSLISNFEISNRRVLFLSTHKAAVYHWQKGRLGSSFLFDVNEEGLLNFERYLREYPNTPVYILVDMFEEEYRRETIPHVFGPDRNAVLQRRKTRLFRDTPYFYSAVQGREASGRRDDRIFMSAITNPDAVRTWVDVLDKYKVPMAGINSLPVFSGSLLNAFPNPSDQMLIVSIQSISGLRQTYFQDREFRISRLVQLPRYGTVSYAPDISEEVEKIRRYLMSMRLISDEQSLDIYFLLTGELLGEIRRQYEDSAMIKYHVLDINSLMEKSGLPRRVSAPFSDQFYVNEFLKKPPRNFYASLRERRYSTMRKMRYSMIAASMIMIIAGVVISGINFVDGLTLKQDSLAAQKKAKFYADRYQMAREHLPRTPVEAAELKVAVDIVNELKNYRTSPVEIIRLISDSLNLYPDLILDNVQWIANNDPNFGSGGARDDNAAIMNANINTTDRLSKGDYYQIAILEGRINNFNGDYRQAIASVNSFTETLRGEGSVYNVSVLDFPLDISSTASLQGNTRAVNKEAKFTIRVVMVANNAT
jgi:hypothetical protein